MDPLYAACLAGRRSTIASTCKFKLQYLELPHIAIGKCYVLFATALGHLRYRAIEQPTLTDLIDKDYSTSQVETLDTLYLSPTVQGPLRPEDNLVHGRANRRSAMRHAERHRIDERLAGALSTYRWDEAGLAHPSTSTLSP